MSPRTGLLKGLVLAAVSALGLGAAGCSMDDVSLNGGVFDMVGMSDSQRAKSRGGEPEIAARPSLVVPPNLNRLPEPGEPQAEVTQEARLDTIQDPDAVKQKSREELEKEQAQYCRANYEIPKSRGDDSADAAEGPLGPCRPSVLNAIKNWNSSEE